MKNQNPFEKHEPTTEKDSKETILLSVNSLYQIENTTVNPDQLLSITTMLMDYSARMLSKYSEQEDISGDGKSPIKYQEIMDKMVEATHIYSLIYAGMTSEEAMDIVGMKAVAHEIPPRNA